MKIFGRDPAVIAAALQALIALLGQQVFDLSAGQTALVYGVSVALLDLWVAYKTSETSLAVVQGLFKAGIACYLGFGGQISPETTSQILAAVSALFGAFQRTQGSPLAKGNLDLAT